MNEQGCRIPGAHGARRVWASALLALAILLAAAGSWLALEGLNHRHLTLQEAARLRQQTLQELTARHQRLESLASEADKWLDQQHWAEAHEVAVAIEALDPGSPVAARARARAAAGLDAQRSEFIAYWAAQAEAALAGEDWPAAEAAIAQVSSQAPADPQVAALKTRLAEGRKLVAVTALLQRASATLQEHNWEETRALAREVLAAVPQHQAAAALMADAAAGEARELAARAQAAEIFAKAEAMDTGVFNQAALDLLREASQLDPTNRKIAALFEKVAAYVRTVRVPEDFPTIAAALREARSGDRLVIGAGTWKEPLLLSVKLDVQGAGAEKTLIECDAGLGSVLSVGEAASGSSVVGIGFRHVMFDPAAERFAVGLVNGVKVSLGNCRFAQGSGHGLAVIGGGSADVRGCSFAGNAWDGVSIYGAGSELQMHDSIAEGNFSHGVDIWDGGSGVVESSRMLGNGCNGVLVQTAGKVSLCRNTCAENREFGIVLGAASAGDARENVMAKNALGGMVTRIGARALSVVGNQSTGNFGPGMVFERGLVVPAGNESHSNHGGEILGDVELPEQQEILVDVPDSPAVSGPPEAVPPRAVIVEDP